MNPKNSLRSAKLVITVGYLPHPRALPPCLLLYSHCTQKGDDGDGGQAAIVILLCHPLTMCAGVLFYLLPWNIFGKSRHRLLGVSLAGGWETSTEILSGVFNIQTPHWSR